MASYDSVLGSISNISSAVGQGLNAAYSILSSEEGSANNIRNTYLSGFFNEGNSKFTPNVFSRLFDEPTYLTFRIEFNFDNSAYNSTSYMDYLPEPLLSLNANKGIDSFKSPSEYYQTDDIDLTFDSLMQEDDYAFNQSYGISNNVNYSTYDYLRNALGESRRADMLFLFVNSLKDIQDHYPYYFQSIEGIGNLLKVNPSDGIRLKDGENILTIKCLEGLDLKITQLLQLYKNIVWDEVYQRWMLPDMMRYFNMKIYISEIRLFHTSNRAAVSPKTGWMYNFKSGNNSLNASSYDQLRSTSLLEDLNNILNTAGAISSSVAGTNSTVTGIIDSTNHTIDTTTDMLGDISSLMYHLCNNAINDVMPTICLDCHMCEFDIEDTLKHINDLHASNKSSEMVAPEINIKVGKLFTKQLYPLNRDLSVTENAYVVNLSDDFMSGAYIDELSLSKRNYTYTDPHAAKTRDESEVDNKGRITSGVRRLGFDTEKANNSTLSYKTNQIDKVNAAVALTQGILNVAADSTRSTATDRPKEVLSNIRNNRNIVNGYRPQRTPTIQSLGERTEYSSTATEHSTYSRDILNLQKRYGEKTLNEAMDYLRLIRSTATESKAVVDAYLDEDSKNVMSEVVLEQILERIQASKATNGENILTEISDIILKDNERSAATKKNNTISGFSLLN